MSSMIDVERTANTRELKSRYEFIDCKQLATLWSVPETWVRERVRSRTDDPLPHVRFGKYVRSRWGSPELEAWAQRRIVGDSNSDRVRVQPKEKM